jgi:hypothetical protein
MTACTVPLKDIDEPGSAVAELLKTWVLAAFRQSVTVTVHDGYVTLDPADIPALLDNEVSSLGQLGG